MPNADQELNLQPSYELRDSEGIIYMTTMYPSHATSLLREAGEQKLKCNI